MAEYSPEQVNPYRPTAERLRSIDEEHRRLELLDYWDTAAIMCLDTDMRIFHRFSELRVFVILRLQHRLQAMQVSLDGLAHKRSLDPDALQDEESLDKITAQIETALKTYDAMLLSSAKVNKLRNPSKRFLSRFLGFCASNFPKVIVDLGVSGPQWDDHGCAVTAIDAEEKSWVHVMIDAMIDRSMFLQKRFNIKEHPFKLVEKEDSEFKQGEDRNVFKLIMKTYSESKIRQVENIFVNVTFSIMLFCPIIALSFIEKITVKLAIVLVFLLLAAILTSGIISTTNNAGLSVLAGYGAILVFFLGVRVDSY